MNTAVAGSSSDGTNAAEHRVRHTGSHEVEALLPQLEKGGQPAIRAATSGSNITTLTPALRQQYGFTPTSGAVVLNVISGSPAAKAGLVQGDVIVSMDGTAVNSAVALQNMIQNSKAGQKVQITYYVGTSKRTTTVTLGTQTHSAGVGLGRGTRPPDPWPFGPDPPLGDRPDQPGDRGPCRPPFVRGRSEFGAYVNAGARDFRKASRHASSSLRAAERSSKPMASVCFSGSKSL